MVFDYMKIKEHLFLKGDGRKMNMECIQIKDNKKRLQCGEHIIKKHKEFFKYDPEALSSERKNDMKSISFRTEGDDFHKCGKYDKAVKSYNKSLCFAVSDENLAITYAKRSEAYLEMGRFTDCRENISLARKYENLSENLNKRLKDYENKCGDKVNPMMVSEMRWEKSNSLTYDRNPRIPFIINRLGLKKEGSEFFLYAKDYIEPGAAVIREEIINTVLMPMARFTFCYYCFKQCYNLIPCPNCTFAMFCNEECKSRANEEFHKWECSALELLYFLQDEVVWISFRLFLKMLNIFGNYIELEKYWEDIRKKEKEIPWYSIDADKYDRLAHLRVFHTCKQKDCKDEILSLTYTAAFFKAEIMKFHKDFQQIFDTNDKKDLFGEIILHHMLSFVELKGITEDGDEIISSENSCHINFTSVIREMKFSNESNVFQHWSDNHMLYIASSPLFKGDILVAPPIHEEKPDVSEMTIGNFLMEMGFLNVLQAAAENRQNAEANN